MAKPLLPFTAIVGQSRLRLALVLVAVQPKIGGVLIRGEKGTAKSTAVRSLAALLPGGGLHTLALNATEDRLIGGLDLDATLVSGSPVFQPGMLAACDGGICYVDEVNLLDDHLANLVLDAAASGVVVVEREGFSTVQPAAFSLVGTMNPEEGGLSPQLLDRFGLCVDVVAEPAVADRAEILARRLAYDSCPSSFISGYAAQEAELATRLAAARARVDQVEVPQKVRQQIAQLCCQALVAGHRADMAMTMAAQAHAAWLGHSSVLSADVDGVAEFALAHRRRDPADPPAADRQPPSPGSPPRHDEARSAEQPQPDAGEPSPSRQAADRVAEVGEAFTVRRLTGLSDRTARSGSGRRQLSVSADGRGHQISSRPTDAPIDLALDATLRAAAPSQRARRARALEAGDGRADLAILVDRADWRRKVRVRRTGSYVVLVVDASGSMGARNRMVASKGAVLSLLLDAYIRRDRVALIGFRRNAAEVLVPPTSSIELAERRLRELPVGGRTPLASGLVAAHKLVATVLLKEPAARPLVIVVTDGRANVSLAGEPSREAPAEAISVARRLTGDPRTGWVVVDTEPPGVMARGRSADLADALSAPRFAIDDLRADDLVRVVQSAQAARKEAR